MNFDNRFWSKVEKTDSCWNWKAYCNHKGYGRFLHVGKVRQAHRVSYEQFKGKIPEGLELDHLCRNRKCVNPEHLEAVTSRENIIRGISANGTKTYCKQGHEFTKENTFICKQRGSRGNLMRKCIACRRLQWHKYSAKKRGVLQ